VHSGSQMAPRERAFEVSDEWWVQSHTGLRIFTHYRRVIFSPARLDGFQLVTNPEMDDFLAIPIYTGIYCQPRDKAAWSEAPHGF